MLHFCNTATLKNLREGFVAISHPKKKKKSKCYELIQSTDFLCKHQKNKNWYTRISSLVTTSILRLKFKGRDIINFIINQKQDS